MVKVVDRLSNNVRFLRHASAISFAAAVLMWANHQWIFAGIGVVAYTAFSYRRGVLGDVAVAPQRQATVDSAGKTALGRVIGGGPVYFLVLLVFYSLVAGLLGEALRIVANIR